VEVRSVFHTPSRPRNGRRQIPTGTSIQAPPG
jgi:hypothetical protein